ncbi:MAG: glycosyltransferase [Calditrichaeota bacterium]|nr:MAG: glycosyltransferase [Calditrichota bacterium]MBL1204054.1 glycosyltransferase [Calditrichota bacterium]NOG43885.1 glycosyltransferase [Calditrichota bacterium]
MKNKKQTLSLCMIVKNEEQFIKDCLESVKDSVDQIVILDTGSTDRTLEIVKNYNAEIHYFDWCDDFAKARNESIKFATSDWILWMDADERLSPESGVILRNELSTIQKPVIYQVQINNKTSDAASAYLSTAYRLFKNNFGIGFKGRIHEQLGFDSKFSKPEIRRSGVIIDHLGYAVDDNLKSQKNIRNLKLLKTMTSENPNDAYAHFTLGQQYNLNEEFALAIEHFEKAVKLKQFEKTMTASLHNVLAESYFKSGDYKSAKENADRSIKAVKDQVGGYYMLYRIADKNELYNEAILAVDSMIKNGILLQKNGWQISTDVIIDTDKLNYTKAVLLEKSSDHYGAFQVLYELANGEKVNEEVLNKAIQLALNLSQIHEATDLLKKLIKFNPDRLDAIDTLGTIFIKLQNFQQAIEVYEGLHEKSPDNEKVSRRLAGLYLKVGQESKASKLLQLAV